MSQFLDMRVNDIFEVDVTKVPHLLKRAPKPIYRITIRSVHEESGFVYFSYEVRARPGTHGMMRVPRSGFDPQGPQLKLSYR